MLGFEMVVVEDREEFADKARAAGADRVCCEDFSSALLKFESDYDTYFVVVTRGHQWDKECIREILKKPYAYVGLLGAKDEESALYLMPSEVRAMMKRR